MMKDRDVDGCDDGAVGDAKRRLRQVATRLFALRGYDGVGIQEIVDSSGVTKPTLYHHFGNKEGLLDAVCREIDDEIRRRIAEPLVYRGDLPRTLEGIAAAFLGFAGSRPSEVRLFIALCQAAPESQGRRIAITYQHNLESAIERLFQAAAADHGNMRGREVAYTASFLGTIFTYCIILMEERIARAPDLAHRIVHQFSHGIYS